MALNLLSSTPAPSTNALAADARTLNSLKLQAGQNTPAAIKETAKQFEALFMRELLKSMREATMKSGLMDSAQGDLGTDLLDQQFAVQMSGQPGGLADLIAQQLTRQMGASPSSQANTMNTSSSPLSTPSTLSLAERNPAPVTSAQASFIRTGRTIQRPAGQLHDRPGRARERLGPARNQTERRQHVLQPVWHQGHTQLDGPRRTGGDHRVCGR
jgi:peptidoglycan hydrolase FlgJ